MRLFLPLLLAAGLLFVGLAVPAAAQLGKIDCTEFADTEICKNAGEDKGEDGVLGKEGILTRITQTVIYITAAISAIAVIIGGFRYVISGGDSAGTKGAKHTIMYALIGLVIALFAQAIVSFVLYRL